MKSIKNFLKIIPFIIAFFSLNNISFSDASSSWQLGFHEAATPIMEGIINFHNHIMFFIVGIAIFVGWLLFSIFSYYSDFNNSEPVDNFTHATTVEVVWTIVPAIILLFIAVPSFSLLYSMDEIIDPAITLKVIGHQWYWSYEYSDYNNTTSENTGINFDSYMVADNDLEVGSFRLLEVDNRVTLPVNTHIRVLITAADVLHSWAVPSFGVKVDACPGRLNQANLFINRMGTFYGQCSELCGVNHGFMPIAVDVVDLSQYLGWLEAKLAENS
jgi:cytochrome c oxidase subunit 2